MRHYKRKSLFLHTETSYIKNSYGQYYQFIFTKCLLCAMDHMRGFSGSFSLNLDNSYEGAAIIDILLRKWT